MRVGIVYHGTFPWNRGIGQLCELLQALGHRPVVISAPGEGSIVGSDIELAPVPPGSPTSPFPLAGSVSPPNPRWSGWIEEVVRERGIGSLIVRETVLAPWALRAGRRTGVPVHLDMRENLAAMYAAGRARNPLLGLLRSRPVVRAFEGRFVPAFDHVFTVSPELREWALERYSLDPRRTTVLANYPSEAFLSLARDAVESGPPPGDPPVLVYAGYIEESRGIQDVVAALPLVRREFPRVRLRIIGSGRYVEELTALSERLSVAGNVEILDMLPPSEVPAALARCHVGLSCYRLNEQTHQTVPGKLFEYMAVRVPVLSSGRRSVVRILEEVGCGVVYPSTRPEDVAGGILELLRAPDAARRMGERGRRAVLEEYSWRSNLDALDSVLGRGGSGGAGSRARPCR